MDYKIRLMLGGVQIGLFVFRLLNYSYVNNFAICTSKQKFQVRVRFSGIYDESGQYFAIVGSQNYTVPQCCNCVSRNICYESTTHQL